MTFSNLSLPCLRSATLAAMFIAAVSTPRWASAQDSTYCEQIAGFAQACMGERKIERVVFVVSGEKENRRGPATQRRKAPEAEICVGQLGTLLVRANITSQHKNLGTRRQPRFEMRVYLKVQVRQQLDLHGALYSVRR